MIDKDSTLGLRGAVLHITLGLKPHSFHFLYHYGNLEYNYFVLKSKANGLRESENAGDHRTRTDAKFDVHFPAFPVQNRRERDTNQTNLKRFRIRLPGLCVLAMTIALVDASARVEVFYSPCH